MGGMRQLRTITKKKKKKKKRKKERKKKFCTQDGISYKKTKVKCRYDFLTFT